MKGLFVELPPFQRHRAEYLDDDEFGCLQQTLLRQPDAGDIIQRAGGLRKLRVVDSQRRKGTRGGLRVIYYPWVEGRQFWLFTLYGKDEMTDLTAEHKRVLKAMLLRELEARR